MSSVEEMQQPVSVPLTIDDHARRQRATAVHDPKELIADIWESDEEMRISAVTVRWHLSVGRREMARSVGKGSHD